MKRKTKPAAAASNATSQLQHLVTLGEQMTADNDRQFRLACLEKAAGHTAVEIVRDANIFYEWVSTGKVPSKTPALTVVSADRTD